MPAICRLHSICQKTQQWLQNWKRSVFIPILKKGNTKEHSNYNTITLILHASKVMLKIIQTRLQHYVNWELTDIQVGFRKRRGTRDQIANVCWIIEKARVPEKYLLLLYWLWQSIWLCDHNKVWKIFQELGIPDHLTYLLRNLYAGWAATVRTWHGTTDWFQTGKGVSAVFCHPAHLTYMQRISCEVLNWMKHKLEARLPGEITITSDMQMCLLSCVSHIQFCDPTDCNLPDSSAHSILRQEYWNGLPLPLQGIFLTQGSNLLFLGLLHWQADSSPLIPPYHPNGRSEEELKSLLIKVKRKVKKLA